MSKCVRCSLCSRLPERRPGTDSHVKRCRECKKKIGVTFSGERFRFAFARAAPVQVAPVQVAAVRTDIVRPRTIFGSHRRGWTLAGSCVLGVFLLSTATYVARSERPISPPIEIAETVRDVPASPSADASSVAVALPTGDSASAAATKLVPIEPGVAKHGGTFVGIFAVPSAESYAAVKPQPNAPRTIAKRIAPPPRSAPMPNWLWTAVRTTEAESLRNVPEVRLHSYKTKGELQKEFKNVVEQHKGGSDAFIAAVVHDRPDLAGLPFLKGGACLISQEQDRSLARASLGIRRLLEFPLKKGQSVDTSAKPANDTGGDAIAVFDRFFGTQIPDHPEIRIVATNDASKFLPALLQILGPKEAPYRIELVRRLAKFPVGDDAILAALVRLALFDPEIEVRSVAIEALKSQSAEKYGRKLLEGFRHASPHVADHAADALVALNLKGLLPQVVDILDEPNPAAPFDRVEDGVPAKAVREMVKINHHRNCMLCHAPSVKDDQRDNLFGGRPVVNAPVPSPGEPFPRSSLHYYGNFSGSEMVVRVNETYLRQDFSRMETVQNPGNWPAEQRFDYLVRTRTLTPAEAAQRQAQASPNMPSAHQRAALSVLTRLTSMYLGAKASDWRDEIAQRAEEEQSEAH